MEPNSFLQPLSMTSALVFVFFFIAFVLVAWILNYHWTQYAAVPRTIEKIRLWYFGGSFILLTVMATALILMFS